MSPCPFPATITITPRAPRQGSISIYMSGQVCMCMCVYLNVCVCVCVCACVYVYESVVFVFCQGVHVCVRNGAIFLIWLGSIASFEEAEE